MQMAKYSDKITQGYCAKDGKPLITLLKHDTVSLQIKFQITWFSTQISIFLLTNLTTAASDVFIGLLCLAGVLRNNQQSLEEL